MHFFWNKDHIARNLAVTTIISMHKQADKIYFSSTSIRYPDPIKHSGP